MADNLFSIFYLFLYICFQFLGGASTKIADTEHTGVLWEYKTENTDDSEIKGPFTTTQMISWAEDGTFNKGVFCRKYQSGSQFYNSSRLDFELYEWDLHLCGDKDMPLLVAGWIHLFVVIVEVRSGEPTTLKPTLQTSSSLSVAFKIISNFTE